MIHPQTAVLGRAGVKQGADKRRITENSEILALFQDSGSYQPDAAGVNGTTFDDLDRYAIDDYLQKVYATTLDGFGGKAEQVLKNIHILNHHGVPTLAGYLFFGKHPEYNCPTCMVKAVSFFGNDLAGTQYRDSKEILGNMPQLYNKSMAFLKANLHNVQEEGASFNTLGKLEIAEEVLEEVIQNALVHRDLLRPAPIRLFVFDNRVEVINPGALAGGLTEEDIRNGKTYQRNPYMATFATNALYYKGIGSGIVRILAEYPEIQLENDASAKEFKVIIKRIIQKRETATQKRETATQKGQFEDIDTTQKKEIATQKNLDTTQKKVLEYFKDNPKATRVDAANALGNITEDGVKFIIAKLQKKGLLKRVGGRKYGEWLVFI
jgi:ATP-dependent DNA helicase RecG